jgi:hypothetical protein
VAAEVEEELNKRWDTDFLKLMDGKRALGEFLSFTPLRSIGDLVSALAHTVREDDGAVPPGIQALRNHLLTLG